MSRSTLDKSMEKKISQLRENYTRGGIEDSNLPGDPVVMLRRWVDEAISCEADEPNAMSLATVSPDGKPNVRVVLLKGIEESAIHFYTNYGSQKGKELSLNPHAAVAFWWPELERQVRIRGPVEKLGREESDMYFQTRPRESQIGAWVSEQSSAIESREALKQKVEDVSARFEGKEVPIPEFWGGYSIGIEEIEFWQGRPGRLHDRILYEIKDGDWGKKRLQP